MAQISTQVFEPTMDKLGLAPRPQQIKMVEIARRVIESVDDNEHIQAGTGVGKSFVNLTLGVEAKRITGKPSVVICPTNRLIDQYVDSDAPKIRKANPDAKIEYLKGRNRYACSESYGFETKFGPKAAEEFRRMMDTGRFEWVQHPGLDDTFGCDGNCENTTSVCGVQWARERAAGADVIITNGHILVFDQLIRDWTNNQARLLPSYGALFIDEAHEIDSVAKGCLSDQIGPKSSLYDKIPGLMKWVMSQITEAGLNDRNREVAIDSSDPALAPMVELADREVARILRKMDQAEAVGDRSVMKNLKKDLKSYNRFLEFVEPYDEKSIFVSAISVEPDDHFPGGLRPTLQRLCIDASRLMSRIIEEQPSLLVSGTVPPSLPFRLGLGNDRDIQDVGTPFDYSSSVLAISGYSPKNKDDLYPRLQGLTSMIREKAELPHAEGGGGTLVLTTSWSDCNMISKHLADNLPRTIPVFVQHKTDAADTAEMLELFEDHGHAVLVGVRTFWTGVNIPGPSLRQVAVWKIPYPVPSVETRALEARLGRHLARQIYDDEMMQQLVQGVGRLIRSVEDAEAGGRVIIFDSRAQSFYWPKNPMSRHLYDFQRIKG